MKLGYLYAIIGISTLALNIVLTVSIIKKHTGTKHKDTRSCDDVITFRLDRKEANEAYTTMAIPYNDTVPLE